MRGRKNNRRGANLVEASLFGLIAVGLISAAYVTYRSVSANNKAQATSQQLTKIHGIIKEAHSSVGSYGTITNLATFLQNRDFPLNQVSNGARPVLKSPTGSTFKVTGANTQFKISYKLLKSKSECEALFSTAFMLDGVDSIFVERGTRFKEDINPAFISATCNKKSNLIDGIEITSRWIWRLWNFIKRTTKGEVQCLF